jgi:hypothetical protein
MVTYGAVKGAPKGAFISTLDSPVSHFTIELGTAKRSSVELRSLVEWSSLFLEFAGWHPHSASPFWHSPTSSFRFGHRTFWIRFEPSRSWKTLADATPPLPCFYPHSEWAASGPGASWGSILIPRSITAVMNLGLLGLPSIARS